MEIDEETPSRTTADAPRPPEGLDPVDAAWLARKSPAAPIILGVLSIALSPLLLGLFFGPLGLRAGIDLRRRGVRGIGSVLAVATSAVGIVLSVTTALLWGALLSSVLLGRDAMRAAEQWRGREIASTTVAALVGGVPREIDLSRPSGTSPRRAILIIDVGQPMCDLAVRSLSEVASDFPEVDVVVVSRDDDPRDVWSFVRLHGLESALRFTCVGALDALPPPLDQAAAIPTFLVVDQNGAIEQAIVGLHPADDLRKLMGGAGALPDEPPAATEGR